MRPENWKDYSNGEKTAHAQELFYSMRGSFVIAQALVIASNFLKDKEPSNAEDMEIIGECLFQPFYDLQRSDSNSGENNE